MLCIIFIKTQKAKLNKFYFMIIFSIYSNKKMSVTNFIFALKTETEIIYCIANGH